MSCMFRPLTKSVRLFVLTVMTRIELQRSVATRHKWTWWRRQCHLVVNAPASRRVLTSSLSAAFVPACRNTVAGTTALQRRWTRSSAGATASAWRLTVVPGMQTLRDTSRAV